MSINRAFVTGRLTRDPELRHAQNGTAILNVALAVNDRRRNRDTGEWEDYPNYISAVFFGNRAEALATKLFKGTKVAVEGKLRWSQWERDGQKRSSINIVADDLEFLSSPNADASAAETSAAAPAPEPAHAAPADSYMPDFEDIASIYDDDIPF